MESDFAQGFVNSMLGWMRSLAAGVSNMLRSGSGSQSGGPSFIDWFKDNWLWLLIALIVLGVLIDWVVWLMRWRPYWLWFKKRRIILDDDADAPRDEYYYEPKDRFHSRALRYDEDRDIEDAGYEELDEGDIEDAGYEETDDSQEDDGAEYDFDEYEEEDAEDEDVFSDDFEYDDTLSKPSAGLFDDGDGKRDRLSKRPAKEKALFGQPSDEDDDIVPSGGSLSRRARRAKKGARGA